MILRKILSMIYENKLKIKEFQLMTNRNPISSVIGAIDICKNSMRSFSVSGGSVIIPKFS